MKVARTVLRGERGSNAPDLLDDYRVLHRSDGGGLDCAGGRCRKLQPQPEPDSHESGQFCCWGGRFRAGEYRRTAERKITETGLRDAYAAYSY